MQIIYRYLRKEIFYSTIAITTIMVFIFISNRLVRFLRLLAQGKYGAGFLLHLVLLQVPILFGLFLPLGLFLGILLSYGRMYVDSEMTVLFACGMDQKKLLNMTLKTATFVATFVAILVFFVNPYINQHQEKLLKFIRSKTIFQTILPNQFQSSDNGKQILYVKNMTPDRNKLKNLFLAEQQPETKNVSAYWSVLAAQSGYQKIDKKTKDHFMVAVNGYRYKGLPGTKSFDVTKFHEYGFRLPSPDLAKYTLKAKAVSTFSLIPFAWINKSDMAELQWRISMPITAIVLTLLAIPLSHVKPRHGRFAKLWIAILIYIIYANLLFVSRDWISQGIINPWIGMWWIHLGMLGIAWGLYKFNDTR